MKKPDWNFILGMWAWAGITLAVLSITSFFGCAPTHPVSTGGIPNLSLVESNIWRGGQPTSNGWAWLKARGVTNVIKFNTESEGSDQWAKDIGMTVCYIPISAVQQTVGPVAPQFKIAMKLVKPGTFVHCEHGANRTGTFFIQYRIDVDEWTKHDAITEANLFGWKNSLPALKEYAKDL